MIRSILVKFGGSIAGGEAGDPVLRDVAALAASGIAVALVHGGGPAVDAELRARGIATRRVGGLRVTDVATMEVVERVLGFQVNTAVVGALEAAGAAARRISGEQVFIARRLRHPDGDLGFVGEIAAVETAAVAAAQTAGAIPVVSPIGAAPDGTRYNINADTAAGALAAALGVDAYVVLTDVARVRLDRSDAASGISRMTLAQAETYRARGVFQDGMIPKVDAALAAVRAGVPRAFICGGGPGAIQGALAGAGTEIVP